MVVNVTDGTVAEEIDYDEFGNVVDDTQPGLIPFGFAGGQYDSDTALLRFGARDYDPSVGRWTARDPLKFRGSPLNLYDYAQGDPVNYVDLDGQGVVAGLAVGLACAAYDTYQAVQTLNQLNALQAQLTALQTQRLRDLQTSCDADNAAGAYGEENELEAQIYSLTLAYARTQNNGAFSTAETSAACLILAGVATLLPTP
jgi:RHS repeat-associated protein